METPRALVAYASRHGSTAEIAHWVADGLRTAGLDTDVAPARQVCSIDDYDVVVLGGALYMGRWHRDARRFARRHQRALRTRAVWLFSSGPLDRSAELRHIPAVRGVAAIGRRLGARGHRTFGGRLATDVDGPLARAMARRLAGDYRNPEAVRDWTHEIVGELPERTFGPVEGRSVPG